MASLFTQKLPKCFQNFSSASRGVASPVCPRACQKGSKSKVGAIKCCKEIKITAPPNEWRNIPLYPPSTPQNNGPAPQVSKQVVNLSCSSCTIAAQNSTMILNFDGDYSYCTASNFTLKSKSMSLMTWIIA